MSDEAKVTRRKLTEYTPDPRNANKGTERGQYMVDTSIEQVGAGRSLVSTANGVIAAGNKTLQALADAGIVDVIEVETDGKTAVVVKRTDWDSIEHEQARKYAYFDNRASEVGLEWDAAQVIADLNAGLDLSDMFSEDELDALLDELGGWNRPEPGDDPGAQIDRAEELRETWGTERGQVWEIPSATVPGRSHRVMCGDSTEVELPEDVDLVLTDPPYGLNVVKVDGATDGGSKPVTIGAVRARRPYPFGGVKNRGTVGSANMVDATPYRPVHDDDKPFDPVWLLGVGGNQIIFGGNYFASKLPDSRCWVVWDKNNTGNFADAELAWTSFDRGVKLYQFTWNGLVREGNRNIEGVKRVHPTQKPVGLFTQILGDFSDSGAVVFDPYLGSGTSLIACEQSGRIGIGCEIDPAYVAVTLERLAGMGLEPRLINNAEHIEL